MNSDIKKKIGGKGEKLAEKFLLNNGHLIIARNYRSRFGEIDIISVRDDVYYFNEVKTVRFSEFHPFEQINQRKLQRIIKTGLIYINSSKLNIYEYSVSAIGVMLKSNGTYKIYYEKHITL